ncbi:hypothetical protein ACFQZ4_12820 [Catellatospora coxensis]
MAARSQEIVDRVHEQALSALPATQRETLLRALESLVTEHLATPDKSAQPVRRARQ